MYETDTFFNLTLAGRIGLALLSIVLAIGLLKASEKLFSKITFPSRPSSIAIKIIIALALFWLFEWLSPQLYYLYYMTLFDGLPWQIVIMAPPLPATLIDLLTFSTKAALSQHSRGLLGWALIILALVSSRLNKEN